MKCYFIIHFHNNNFIGYHYYFIIDFLSQDVLSSKVIVAFFQITPFIS